MGIQVPPDSTGKVVETNSPDGSTQRQVVTIGDKTTAGNTLNISGAGAAKVDGSAVTQPVSIASPVPVTGTFFQTTQPVSGTFFQVTQPVSGTFWQTTQPVSQSGTWTDNQSLGTAGFEKITDGTNTAAVKAASTAAIATDPALVVAISPNNTVGVTGTFFQATQPISGTVTTTPPANQSVNVNQWAGTGLTAPVATAPAGTETAPVTRPIQRKATTTETTAQLTANSVFTGAWHDSQADGTSYVYASAFADRASAAQGFVIQVSDDSSNASFTRSVGTVGTAISTLATIRASITARYWRVVFTNGAAGTTTNLEINSTAFAVPPAQNPAEASASYGAGQMGPMVALHNPMAAPQAADGDSNLAGQWPMSGGATRLSISNFLFNGATWDRARNNYNTTTGDTGTKVATFNGATQTNYDSVGAIITILLGTVSGTTPTLAAQLQWSFDAGTNWLNIGPAMANLTTTGNTGVFHIHPSNLSQSAGTTPATLTNGATASVFLNMGLPRTWRIVYTIAGTTPSFAITNVYVNYIRG